MNVRTHTRALAAFAAAFGLLATMAPLAAGASPSADDDGSTPVASAKGTGNYIVLLAEDPVVTYEGGTPGLEATAPPPGETVDQGAPAVEAYVEHLEQSQDAALAAVGASPDTVLVNYAFAVNGFTASLSESQAQALKSVPGVALVVPDVISHIQTGDSAAHRNGRDDFLRLRVRRGPYDVGLTGEDVVVGVIDTGIWPEHPSFADDGTYDALPATEFSGTGCEFGNTAFNPADAPFTCNNKLLAAKAYGEVFHGGTGEGLDPGSFLSARDEDGHGTHTSSTAAGNDGVTASIFSTDFGTVSGVAPRARISMYKACWSTTPEEGGCSNADLVDAIDQAVADGVDVINYSIGSDTPALAFDSISFLLANDAGVFVAASAGNAGPGEATVGSPAIVPWLTAVGASTQSIDFKGTVTLGNGETYEGATVTPGIGMVPLVDAADHGNPLCEPGVGFDPPVAGKMVLCERGVVARVAKSKAVADAGGVAMLLFNTSPNTENTDNHYIPALHVDEESGLAIRAYIDAAGASATASLSGGEKVYVKGNQMADFSSRGPNLFSPDIISPDVTAPGVNILAGASPAGLLGAPGQLFQAISGTSMSSPHVAGTYALLKQAHPDWTPAMAKSALMTTARQNVVKEDGETRADPFDFGAGHIVPGGNVQRPGSLYNPGLVYDATALDYLGYLCEPAPVVPEVLFEISCDDLAAMGIPTTAENLNLASIGVADVVGTSTLTRTVTNVTGHKSLWFGLVRAPTGFTVKVEPWIMFLQPGESKTFTVTISRTNAAYDTWSFGSLTWYGIGGYQVRSPIAAQAKEFAAPDEVTGVGTEGTGSFEIGFGYTGPYAAAAHGLVPAHRTDGNVVDDPANDIAIALTTGVGITEHELVIPAGTALARIALFDAFTDGEDDLDLYVFDEAGELVGGSGSGTSEEQVDLVLPAAGTYTVVVHGWQTDGPDANYTLFDWVVPIEPPAGNLTITAAPTEAVTGTTATVEFAWSGLATPEIYLGAISHNGPDGILALTTVTITT